MAGVHAMPNHDEHKDHDKNLHEVIEHCAEQVHANEHAVESLMKFEKLDDSKEAKCLVKCMMDIFEAMDKEGHFDKAKLHEFAQLHYSDHDVLEKVYKIFDHCLAKDHKAEDPCDKAFHFVDCYRAEAEKEKVPKLFN
uniref:Odorant-binding protein 12 n=1 Tax=Yemma signatus TaxID=300820 RepID=A0A3G2GRU7_9HEMI|nr:odorant-binding protein 12 [Yemma signatus]